MLHTSTQTSCLRYRSQFCSSSFSPRSLTRSQGNSSYLESPGTSFSTCFLPWGSLSLCCSPTFSILYQVIFGFPSLLSPLFLEFLCSLYFWSQTNHFLPEFTKNIYLRVVNSQDTLIISCFLTSCFSVQLASLVTQTVKNLPAMQETRVRSLGRKIPWRREWQPL